MSEKAWLNDNQLSLDIWNKKYRVKNESFNEWLNRVSGGDEDIKQLILDKKFLFGGRILASRGVTDRKVTYSNCYVITPPEDNIESIFETASKLARTYSYGGGCGVDISKLRPKDAIVHNAAKSTSGAVSFMDFYSYVTGLIGQSGRRGALLLTLDCSHPDIEEFINLKTKQGVCEKANISIRVSDDFMNAVENNEDWITEFNSPETGKITRTFKARDLLMLLAKRNWEWAEPGLVYWDTIEQYNMLNNNPEFKYAGLNPCAEESLPAGGSCLLGSINLSEFVDNPFTSESTVNLTKLESTVHTAVRGLNQVLLEGINLHPLQEQRESVNNWRQIGLGTFGLADLLIKIGVRYGSSKSIDIINIIYKTIAVEAVKESLNIAKSEQGMYPKCIPELVVESNFIKSLDLSPEILNEIKQYGLAHSQILTCPPTGSTATMFQVSTGLEPNFALKYTRKTQSLNGEDTYYEVFAKIVDDYIEVTGNKILPDYFITSENIHPLDRIKVQSTIQKYVDASLSSTVNLSKEATIEDVYDIYVAAWKAGCKGITVYRSGCYREGILTVETPKEEIEKESIHELQRGEVIPAGNNWVGLKRILTTGCGSLHCTAYFDPNNGELRECYLSKGSTGGCQNFMIGLSRFISLSARSGVKIDDILDQLKSCGTCPSYAVRTATKKDTSKGSSCPVAVGKALKEMYDEFQNLIINKEIKKTPDIEKKVVTESSYEECPQCHEKTLTHVGGCTTCTSCGYSKCD